MSAPCGEYESQVVCICLTGAGSPCTDMMVEIIVMISYWSFQCLSDAVF